MDNSSTGHVGSIRAHSGENDNRGDDHRSSPKTAGKRSSSPSLIGVAFYVRVIQERFRSANCRSRPCSTIYVQNVRLGNVSSKSNRSKIRRRRRECGAFTKKRKKKNSNSTVRSRFIKINYSGELTRHKLLSLNVYAATTGRSKNPTYRETSRPYRVRIVSPAACYITSEIGTRIACQRYRARGSRYKRAHGVHVDYKGISRCLHP